MPSEVFVVSANTSATIERFSLANDGLDLTALLTGASGSLSQSAILSSGLSVTDLGADTNNPGFYLTNLAVNGPGGSASVTLSTTNEIASGTMPSALYNALVLPK